MDLLASQRVYETIRTVDYEGSQKLADFVSNLTYRERDYLIDGYGGIGGKMSIRIKYRLLQSSEIERTVTVRFTSDAGSELSLCSTIIVEKIPKLFHN